MNPVVDDDASVVDEEVNKVVSMTNFPTVSSTYCPGTGKSISTVSWVSNTPSNPLKYTVTTDFSPNILLRTFWKVMVNKFQLWVSNMESGARNFNIAMAFPLRTSKRMTLAWMSKWASKKHPPMEEQVSAKSGIMPIGGDNGDSGDGGDIVDRVSSNHDGTGVSEGCLLACFDGDRNFVLFPLPLPLPLPLLLPPPPPLPPPPLLLLLLL
jgi:hypothetical protein